MDAALAACPRRTAGARGAKCVETGSVSVCIKAATLPGEADTIYAQGKATH